MATLNGLGGESTHVTVARGKTYLIRDLLGDHGFKWDGSVWKLDPAMPDDEIPVLLRKIRRVSIDGFDASKVEVKNIRREWL